MRIIIAGCGKIGSCVLKALSSEGHDVIALDSDSSVIDEITNIYDVMAICGNCADCETLEETDIDKADIFAAFTGSDELNMLSCFIAKKMGAKNTIARIRNPEYNDRSLGFMRQQLNLSMSVNPELLAARELFNMLKLPSAVKIESFSKRNLDMVEMRLREDSPLSGMKLSELNDRYKAKTLVCVVQRGEEIFIPDGSFELKGGDKIGLTASRSDLQKLLKSIGKYSKQSKNIMIFGGSKTAFYLAKMLLSAGASVKIIEKDETRCRALSDALPKATIIHGDGARQELLLEEGLRSLDAFVSLTGMDEENILISIYALENKVHKVIAKINKEELLGLAERLGVDSIVSPKNITSDILVRYARALENSEGYNVETLYKIMDGKAEALEFNVKNSSKITDVPLKDLPTKRDTLIAGIVRGRKTIIPGGDDTIQPGDKVIVIAKEQRLRDLGQIVG